MRVFAVHPSPLMYTRIYLRLEPLGLELVAQAVRRAGHEVRIIDLQVETHRDLFRLIEGWAPEVIAFSCNYLANIPEIVDLAKAIKAARPRCFVCVGRHSASFVAEEHIEHGAGTIDCVLRGEGEADSGCISFASMACSRPTPGSGPRSFQARRSTPMTPSTDHADAPPPSAPTRIRWARLLTKPPGAVLNGERRPEGRKPGRAFVNGCSISTWNTAPSVVAP